MTKSIASDSRNNGTTTGKPMPPVEHRFQPGNPGRPKGARHKLGQAFLEAMLTDFAEHGIEVIAAVRDEKPDQYLKVVASILPKEFEAGEETINVLAELLARIDGRTRTIVPLQLTATAH